MNLTEIPEGNKLIAEFMELGMSDSYGYFYVKLVDRIEMYNQFQFMYHLSWDWLMPVVEKIERLYETETSLPMFEINSHYCKFALTYPHKYKAFITGCYRSSPEEIKANSKIEAAWIVAVEFIKYYNKQNNK